MTLSFGRISAHLFSYDSGLGRTEPQMIHPKHVLCLTKFDSGRRHSPFRIRLLQISTPLTDLSQSIRDSMILWVFPRVVSALISSIPVRNVTICRRGKSNCSTTAYLTTESAAPISIRICMLIIELLGSLALTKAIGSTLCLGPCCPQAVWFLVLCLNLFRSLTLLMAS